MKRVFTLLTVLALCSFLAAAQTDSGKGAQKKGAKGGASVITGCLSGPNDEGVYVLKHGKSQTEVGGLDELSKHAGHTVKLHGSWAKSGAEIGEKEDAAAEKKEAQEKGHGKKEAAERHFKVTSIDHVADTCQEGGGPRKAARRNKSRLDQKAPGAALFVWHRMN